MLVGDEVRDSLGAHKSGVFSTSPWFEGGDRISGILVRQQIGPVTDNRDLEPYRPDAERTKGMKESMMTLERTRILPAEQETRQVFLARGLKSSSGIRDPSIPG